MSKNKFLPQQLPHILRNISRIGLAVLLVAAAFALTDWKYREFRDPLTSLKLEVAKNPDSSALHLALARQAASINNFEIAKNELEIALSLEPNNTQITKELARVTASQTQEKEIEAEISKWEKIVALYPNFRDGWFMLSALYWQSYRDDKAKEALDTVFLIDPNFVPAKEFLTTINKESN